jgi:hypothetical protein
MTNHVSIKKAGSSGACCIFCMALIETDIPTKIGPRGGLPWITQEQASERKAPMLNGASNSFEFNNPQFEAMRHQAYDSGLRQITLESIEQALLQHKEATKNYSALREPHPDASESSWKQRQNDAHATWLALEFERGGLLEKQKEHQTHISKTYKTIENFIRRNAGNKTKTFEQNTIQSITTLLENTADDISAPVIIDGIIQYLKKHGLYEQIDRILFPLMAFAQRSLNASDATQSLRVEDMFRLTTRNYIRNVLLTEGSLDTFDLWHKKAVNTTIDTITPPMVDAVFSIYREVGVLQDITAKTQWTRDNGTAVMWYEIPRLHQAITRLFSTSLVSKGGPLEVTRDFFTATAYRTHRPFAYFEDTRYYMLFLSLPGVRDDVLTSFLPAGIGLSKFDDTRILEAIPRAIEINKKNKLHTRMNKEPEIKQEPPRVLFRKTPAIVKMEEEKRAWKNKPNLKQTTRLATDGATQWLDMLSHIGRMAREGDEVVRGSIQRIAASDNKDAESIRGLLSHVLHTLTPEDKPILQDGLNSESMIVNQFLGRWMVKVDRIVLGSLVRWSQEQKPEVALSEEAMGIEKTPPPLSQNAVIFESPPVEAGIHNGKTRFLTPQNFQ